MNKTRLILVSLFLGVSYLKAQDVVLRIYSDKKGPVDRLSYKKLHKTREDAYRELNSALNTLQSDGYLLADADSLWYDSNSVNARVLCHERFKFAKIRLGNLNPVIAGKSGFNENLYNQKPLRYKELARGFEKILKYYENNGYPFASLRLDSVVIEGQELSATLLVNKNKLYRIDSIRVEGNANVKKSFLHQYLSVSEGMPYNEEILRGISRQVKQLAFVKEKQGQVVRLSDKTNRLILFLDKKNASQFDGIIGVLPNASTGKTIITGDLKLKLVNSIFRNGETFDLQWRRLQNQTQDFAGRLIYPYIAGSPVGADYYLKIYRKDSSFIDINNQFAIHYYYKGLNYIKLGYKQRNSNLLSTSNLYFVNGLPEYADVITRSYGLGLLFENLDYRFNPSRGVSLLLNGQTGNRQILKNPNISDQVYQNLVLKTLQYQFDANMAYYLNLHRNHVLKFAAQAASVFGNSTIFRNELFRIGGLRTLRGFDEESIYASSYVISSLEYRFLFSQNSNLFVFTDGAWYENVSNGTYVKDSPLSFGAGINVETKAGILTLTYALGRQFSNAFDLRSGKIHFGLIALF
ncbi:MAG TPA: BamA/TamA family outer membrane protein [Bacteroidia bacterium]|nr:BamA/TamA family outer membrane protein [Bacteroidia bacterium]